MKNILFIHSSADMYGSDRALLNIAKYIDKKSYNIYILVPSDGPLVTELKKIDNITIYIYPIAVLRRKNLNITGMFKYTFSSLSSYKFITKILKENKIDIVYTNTSVVLIGAITAKHHKVKSICHVREIIKNKHENKFISAFLRHYADVIIVNSKATGKSLNVSSSKIKLIYDAVEEQKKQGNNKPTNPEVITIGMAGRINRWKGQKLFVDAASLVLEKHPNILFQIAGNACFGEEFLENDLRNYIMSKNIKDKVIMLGYLDDMSSFYENVDIFVLPSIQPEPFGLVITEAMDYGIPVVATNHGGPTEILVNGESGYLVDYKSAKEMAKVLIMLIEDANKRKTIGANGKKRKRELFAVSTMINDTEKILSDIE